MKARQQQSPKDNPRPPARNRIAPVSSVSASVNGSIVTPVRRAIHVVVDAGNQRCHNQVHELGPAGRRVVLYSSADLEAVTVMVSAAALSRLEVFVCRSAAALAIGCSDGCAEVEA